MFGPRQRFLNGVYVFARGAVEESTWESAKEERIDEGGSAWWKRIADGQDKSWGKRCWTEGTARGTTAWGRVSGGEEWIKESEVN